VVLLIHSFLKLEMRSGLSLANAFASSIQSKNSTSDVEKLDTPGLSDRASEASLYTTFSMTSSLDEAEVGTLNEETAWPLKKITCLTSIATTSMLVLHRGRIIEESTTVM
jgi:hypothetical protein